MVGSTSLIYKKNNELFTFIIYDASYFDPRRCPSTKAAAAGNYFHKKTPPQLLDHVSNMSLFMSYRRNYLN